MTDLAQTIARVAADLQDPDHAYWSTADHEANLRRALAHYSLLNPRRAQQVLPTSAGQREIDLSPLGALEVVDLWYPWDPDHPPAQPGRPPFILLDATTLYLESDGPPQGTLQDQLRLFYLAPHTLSGLTGATLTTLDEAGLSLLVLLATAAAAMQRCQSTIGRVTVSNWTAGQLLEWAQARQRQADAACEALRRRLASAQEARVTWEAPL